MLFQLLVYLLVSLACFLGGEARAADAFSRHADSVACRSAIEGRDDILSLVLAAQKRQNRPTGLRVVRLVKNRGEVDFVPMGGTYALARTYDTGNFVLGAFPVPFISISSAESFYRIWNPAMMKLQASYVHERAFEASILEETLAEIREETASGSERAIFYGMQNPIATGPDDFLSAFVRLLDASDVPGESEVLMALEKILKWRAPERGKSEEHGIVELGLTLKLTGVNLRKLDSFYFIGKEIGTYVDLRFLQRGIPATVRLLADKETMEVFTDAENYGFTIEKTPKELGRKNDWILKQDGQEFVKRFGSRWQEWKIKLEMNELPLNPLSNPSEFRAAIANRYQGYKRYYQAVKATCDQNPGFRAATADDGVDCTSIESFLDGWYRMDAPLLF